jgi:hypothetical protein
VINRNSILEVEIVHSAIKKEEQNRRNTQGDNEE